MDVEVFHPWSVKFEKGKREKLKRCLDVTRAERFFARRVIFVEGAAELLLVNLFARRSNLDLRNHGVSLISVEGLNLDSFMPLFDESAIRIPVAVITDADPKKVAGADGKEEAVYPGAGDAVTVSDNAAAMKALEDGFVKVFFGQKTLENDLALTEKNRTAMLAALKDIHPVIGKELEKVVSEQPDDRSKGTASSRACSSANRTMSRRALAARVEENNLEIDVPSYIFAAIKHACTQ